MMASTTDPGRTVLVTGGTGYLGSWVVARLLARGYRVRATVRGVGWAGALRSAVARQAPVDAFTVVAADLLAGDCWDEAMRGVDDVIHVASPLPGDSAQDIVSTARTGAHHVIAAAGRAGVGRIVMTSSLAAAATGRGGELIDENTWSSPTDSPGDAYARSKTLAERDAWHYAEASGLSLTTILPGWIMGPAIDHAAAGSSAAMFRQLLAGKMPALPNFGGLIVDVRDIADLHIQALTAPQAAGQRLLAVGEFRWLRDIALLLRARLGEQASKVCTRRMPDPVVRLAARFNPDIAYIAASLRYQPRVDGSKVEQLLDWRTRPAEQTVLDAANSVLGRLPEEGHPGLTGHASDTLQETESAGEPDHRRNIGIPLNPRKA